MRRVFERAGTGIAVLVVMTACAPDASQIAAPLEPGTLTASVNLGSSQVVYSNDGGAFFAAPTPNYNGILKAGPFWDNWSGDDQRVSFSGINPWTPPDLAGLDAVNGCNAGFYALLTGSRLATDCRNPLLGSYGNMGGGYTRFFGNDGGKQAATFKFNGNRSYTLRFLGGYRGANSEIGIFYKNDKGAYRFEKLTGEVQAPDIAGAPQVVNTVLETTKVIPSLTENVAWGFYIKSFTNINGKCDAADVRVGCSDALGTAQTLVGATLPTQPVAMQQWALFSNGTATSEGTKFMAAAEDNLLALLPNYQVFDMDYNDAFIEVVAGSFSRTGNGCSPGYWKNTRRSWPSPYLRTQLFNTVFRTNTFPNMTLDAVLRQGGSGEDVPGVNSLGRQAVAALLNAAAAAQKPSLFPLGFELTTANVISQFQTAVNAGGTAIVTQKDAFESFIDVDGRTCPISNR